MADSTRRQIAQNLFDSFLALTTTNGSKINVGLVERYLTQPEEHPAELGDNVWRVGFVLGLETPDRSMARVVRWSMQCQAEAFTSRQIDSWSETEIRAGAIEQWRQEIGADALNELQHAIEGTDDLRRRGGYAILSEVQDRYVDEGFGASEASSGSRIVVAGCVQRFRVVYQESLSRS